MIYFDKFALENQIINAPLKTDLKDFIPLINKYIIKALLRIFLKIENCWI